MAEPYHRYVYDERRRVLVGAFEEMYRNEERDGYDSWHQDDLSQRWRALALALIESLKPTSIIDIGCGKGAFTSRLVASRIVGLDISETALEKARARNPRAEFCCLRAEETPTIDEHFDLAVCLELLSYVEDWRRFLDDTARIADALVLSLYLPPAAPIGSVKSFDDLRDGVRSAWHIECEALVTDRGVDGSQILVLARSRDGEA
jgi:SAM-dependent methyltransferase